MNQHVFEIDSDPKALKPLRDEISELLKKKGFETCAAENILVALCEACTNATRHSYGEEPGHTIRVTLEDYPNKIILKVRDYGKKIELDKVREPKLPPDCAGGLGIHFMKTMMDEFQYNTTHRDGNELVMAKFKK